MAVRLTVDCLVALVDACVTEWRPHAVYGKPGLFTGLHSLMLVLLNGG